MSDRRGRLRAEVAERLIAHYGSLKTPIQAAPEPVGPTWTVERNRDYMREYMRARRAKAKQTKAKQGEK